MDLLIDNQCDLNEIVIETILESRNIKFLFQTILFKCNEKLRLFFFFEHNKLMHGMLPFLTRKMEQIIKQKGVCITQDSYEQIVERYAEERKMLLVILFGEIFLVKENEMVSLLLYKMNQNLTNGKQLKRQIDTDVFQVILALNRRNRYEKDSSCNFIKKQQHEEENVTTNKTKTYKDGSISTKETSRLKSLLPRNPHTATVIEADKSDIFDDIILDVIPNDKVINEKRLYPNSSRETPVDDKYPIQEVEVDAGISSFEPYPGNTSILSTSREIESGRRQGTQESLVTSSSGIPFHSKPSRYREYRDDKKRHESFQTHKWRVDSKPDVNLFVSCGFYFTGKEDLVRCHHCGIGLKDWIKEDDVLTEHVKYSPMCDFLIWRYGKPMVYRIKAAMSNESSSETELRQTSPPYKIRSPRYQTMEARLASFENFPSDNNVPHQQLAVAGLYFTEQGDLCRCFTCDGGLKDWSPGDDPIKEHAKYFSNCPYINKLKGPEYVQLQQQNRPGNGTMGAVGGGSNTSIQETDLSTNIPIEKMTLEDSNYNVSEVVQNMGYSEMDIISAKAELQKKKGKSCILTVEEIVNKLLDMKEKTKLMQAGGTDQEEKIDLEAMVEENKQLTRLMYCMLCVTGEADILFMPCTHHRTCHKCAADLTFCPVCDLFIEEKIKTFRA